MAYFYVRNDGTATGDLGRYATKQTGDWDTTFTATTEFYASISDAVNISTTPPATGDIVVVSNIHNITYGASVVIDPLGHVKFISVDDTAMEDYLAGATEKTTGTPDIDYKGDSTSKSVSLFGITVSSGDNIDFDSVSGGYMYAEDCTFILNSSVASNFIQLSSFVGGNVTWVNVDVQLPDIASITTGGINIGNGTEFRWMGGSIIFNSVKASHAFNHASGGSNIDISEVDFTNITTSILDVDSAGDSFVDVNLSNCKKPSGASYNSASLTVKNLQIVAAGVGDADQYYDYYHESYAGSVVSNTTVYRNNGSTYDGSNGYSLLYTSINIIEYINTLSIDVPGAWMGDLTSSLTLTLSLIIDNPTTTATTLTDAMFGIIVTRPDGTDQALGVNQESRSSNVMSTPVTLSSSTEAWTGVNSTNSKPYKVSVTIPALSGVTNGRVLVNAWCAATGLHADDKIYVCPLFELA